ncbi:hypothetical protein ATO6_09380 [Oceanicola sp. 22II-s10i]|uniref:hypothetical protein n=1 Tax=Oceanicola sp. 22II-s10i TaxID=1317116 RepID=UPI000B524E1A|nr:hypothetical protein [Oceanicola sp. 22II-s10i]OWU85230.1 hypothetical protein ATO6_09380 [Oceanicola sp. 22II-s10i]
MLLLRSFACAVALSSAAQADCPTAADAATGITLHQQWGQMDLFQVISPELTAYSYRDGGNVTTLVLMARGVYVLERVYTNSSTAPSRVSFAFDMTPDDMPVPEAGLTWEVKAIASGQEGATWPETHVYAFGEETEIGIGPCTYRAIPFTLTAKYEDEADWQEASYYLPDLGFGFITNSPDGEGGRIDYLQSTIGRFGDLDLYRE